jgi:hypothetical protein
MSSEQCREQACASGGNDAEHTLTRASYRSWLRDEIHDPEFAEQCKTHEENMFPVDSFDPNSRVIVQCPAKKPASKKPAMDNLDIAEFKAEEDKKKRHELEDEATIHQMVRAITESAEHFIRFEHNDAQQDLQEVYKWPDPVERAKEHKKRIEQELKVRFRQEKDKYDKKKRFEACTIEAHAQVAVLMAKLYPEYPYKAQTAFLPTSLRYDGRYS